MRICLLAIVLLTSTAAAQQKHVAVYFEGPRVEENLGRGDAFQLAQLMGHFNTRTSVHSVEEFRRGDLDAYDAVFFIGYTLYCAPPVDFMRAMVQRKRTTVWLHTGMLALADAEDLDQRFGFVPTVIDTVKGWTRIERGGDRFTKTEPNITLCQVTDRSRCSVVAEAVSRRKGRTPYILRSDRFWYVADSPFAFADERDRYLLFADVLHDILEEDHPRSHRAIVRIEDVHPLEQPDRLREMADVLHDEDVPFLVSIVPFYVDPERGIRVGLTDKPEFVDAIRYMIDRGGTVAMHGATHQYKGITAADYEFWDVYSNGPLQNESLEYVRQKVSASLEECIRNGIYPILWETPHYTASMITYDAVSSIFSSAMEQRCAINHSDYTQFFPYIIERDLHGQKIYPENLGYVPLDPQDAEKARRQVELMIGHARVNLAVRDGFASAFYHSFVPHENLRRLVRGLKDLGYSFVDLQRERNVVQLHDKAIVTGGGEITIELQDQYLREYWFARNGELERSAISPTRLSGVIRRDVRVEDGQLYLATPTELRGYEEGFVDRIMRKLRGWYADLFEDEDTRRALEVAVLWDSTATGGGMRDQQSFVNAFRYIGVDVDTLHLGARFEGGKYTLLVIPQPAVERLRNPQFSELIEWVRSGGMAITDGYNEFALELGIEYTGRSIGILGLREHLYPEDKVQWHVSTPFRKFEVQSEDIIFASDPETGSPIVIGRVFGAGKFLYLGTRFDPLTSGGFSRYPFLLQYVASHLELHPVFRRDALELFFDPGFRSAIPIESLVRRWITHGVRAIHVGNWHEYADYTYDYERLIRLCHENGILVYAWLEAPQVSHKFWEEHPEWREKNVHGDDNRASWRYPLAMTDSAAVSAMLRKFRRFLRMHDFDGVNIAETYFESDVRGPREPGNFAPMHPSARREFKRLRGFDPRLLFDVQSPYYWETNPAAWKAFEDYRVDKVVEMHERLLSLAYEIRDDTPGFGVVVTMLDNIGSPGLRRSQGIDIERILELHNRYPFTLVVEDPMARWSEHPDRYREIARLYRERFGDSFALDINILSFRSEEEPTMFPTLVQSGLEAFALQRISSEQVTRTLMYAESSINAQDLSFMSYAATGQTRYRRTSEGYTVHSPVSLTLQLGREQRFILVDGDVRTSAGDGRFLIAAGTHAITLTDEGEGLFDPNTLHATLLSCTGNVLAINEGERSVRFDYHSEERCFATFNKRPLEVYVDGSLHDARVFEGIERYSVLLPAGNHSVRVVTQGTVSYSIDLTSLWSSTFIVLFGVLSLILLSIMYLVVRIRRRKHPLPAAPPQKEGV